MLSHATWHVCTIAVNDLHSPRDPGWLRDSSTGGRLPYVLVRILSAPDICEYAAGTTPEKWEVFDQDEPFVPDLCVEVLLDRDPQPDLARRVNAYLAGGAGEVILVRPDGQREFWGARGLQQASRFRIALSLERIYFDAQDLSSARRVASLS